MSTSEPLDVQRPSEEPQSAENPQPDETTQPLSAPPQPVVSQGAPQPVPTYPRNRRPLALLLLLSLAALSLLLVAGGAGVYWWQASLPAATVATFCGAMKRQDYAAAYLQLSGTAKAATQSTFAHDAQLQDQIDGRVRACAVITSGHGAASAWSQTPQTMTLEIARNHGYAGPLTLTRDGFGWKIGALDEVTLGPVVGPWEASQRFCSALAAGDFTSAYSDLSRQGQANASQADFTKAFADALSASGAQIASCQLDVTSYSAQSVAASVVATLTVRVTTANGAISAPVLVRFALINESGAWKLDHVQPFSGT
jgi:hypothetical protein